MKIVARFSRCTFCPGSYPPLAPRSLRIFTHADGPTSLMRGEGHLAGGIGGGRRRRDMITKLFGCVNVIMCGHDHMTC